MAEKSGHFGSQALDDLHRPVKNSTEDGACLAGHQGNFNRFRNKVSCNYRYQAYEQAKAEARIKERLHHYKMVVINADLKTSAYDTEAGGKAPAHYCAALPPPEDGDWDIDGPNRDILRTTFRVDDKGVAKSLKVPKKQNFTQDTWPYWNNAHHLIPKGTLKAEILKEHAPVDELIQQALLSAHYNVNHKVNMLFLPQDREVAQVLSLPRHIQLKDDDAPDLEAMCTDHPVYNQMVREMDAGLKSIISSYRSICDNAVKEVEGTHDVPNAKLDKAKLEQLSRDLLDILLQWGGVMNAALSGSKRKGRSLDALAQKSVRKQLKTS